MLYLAINYVFAYILPHLRGLYHGNWVGFNYHKLRIPHINSLALKAH